MSGRIFQPHYSDVTWASQLHKSHVSRIRLLSKKTSKFRVTGPLWGESIGQWSGKVSMSRRHHDNVLSPQSYKHPITYRKLVIIDLRSSINQQNMINFDRSVTCLSALSPHCDVVLRLRVYRNSIRVPVNITAALRGHWVQTHIIFMNLHIGPALKCREPSIDHCIFPLVLRP